jgi:hypothetical protein
MDRLRLQKRLAEIAASPKNVRFEELESLLENQIRNHVTNYNHHHKGSHHAFTVGASTFTIPKPHRGFVKQIYVKNLLNAMEAEGLHDPETAI